MRIKAIFNYAHPNTNDIIWYMHFNSICLCHINSAKESILLTIDHIHPIWIRCMRPWQPFFVWWLQKVHHHLSIWVYCLSFIHYECVGEENISAFVGRTDFQAREQIQQNEGFFSLVSEWPAMNNVNFIWLSMKLYLFYSFDIYNTKIIATFSVHWFHGQRILQ